MKRFSVSLIFCATALFADTAETAYFRGLMSPANEVPAVNIQGSAAATLVAHIVRDNSGKIISGSVDFNIAPYVFPGPVSLTGLHIHPGAAGVNGPVTIKTDLGSPAPTVDPIGIGFVIKQGQVLPTDQTALDTLNGMLKDPSQYYVNIHTTDFPGGAMRAQLQRADVTVLMGIMSPLNENPPFPDQNASGVSQAIVIAGRNSSGVVTSGQVIFDINYNFGQQVSIVGFHIHNGAAGVNGPVIINTGIAGTPAAMVQTDATGAGTLRRIVEIDMTNAAQVDTLNGLLTHPKDYYINMHTAEFPGGLIRDQLRTTDTMNFQVTMLPSNENPPIAGLDATAPTVVSIRTVRAEDGSVLAGVASFDVNYRFPVAHVEFTGLHVHDGAAGVNGPVRLASGLTGNNSIVSETGFGNIFLFQTMSDPNAVATLNSLVANPENHYANIHTSVNGGGAARAQLTPVNTTRPAVSGGGNAANGTVSAPAGLISIYGTNLTKVTGDLSGWQGKTLPTSFNGSKLTIGGKNAPIIFVSPGQINAQVPVDVAAGSQPVVVTTGNGASAATNVTIAGVAPAVFAPLGEQGRGILTHQDFSLVGPDKPAKAGEVLIIWATGLGQTTPPMSTGGLVNFPPQSDTATVNVTIGGQDARVIYSIASPNFAGLYQIAVTMPSGVAAGSAPVVLRMGSATSATVNIAVQ